MDKIGEVGYQLSDQEFKKLSELVYEESGIYLSNSKKSLMVSRLTKRLRQLELPTFGAYYDYVVEDQSGDEFVQLLDLISTNKTEFFRESHHFEFLKKRVIPDLRSQKKIRIWSAACSSGEEPYTIAMTLMDSVTAPMQWDMRILASDLSTRVLAKASSGIYSADHLTGLPPELARRFFLKERGSSSGRIKAKDQLRDLISFRRINLMDERFPIKTPLDVVFCRNVMIYFDKPTQERLVSKFHRVLKPGGYLFIGHSESLQWIEHSYRHIQPTIYQK